MKTPPSAIAKTQNSELPPAVLVRKPAKTDRQIRIQDLIKKIQRKDGFKASEMKAALGATAWRDFQKQTRSTSIPKEASKLLRPYQEALQRADALNRLPARPPLSPKQRFKIGRPNSAEKEYARALELLQCLIDEYPSIASWLDRPVRFGVSDDPPPNAEQVPRVRGSRSPYALPILKREDLDATALATLFAALECCTTLNSASPLAWLLPQNEQANADVSCPVQKKFDWLL